MNEAFTIGNNNSIYTFGQKKIVCWQAQTTQFHVAEPRNGRRMSAPGRLYQD